MRSLNAIELLNLIREHGRISRVSLAKISKLSKPTVSDLVNFLIHRHLVREGGAGTSGTRGGKKPTFVEFNASFGKIAAADVGPEQVRFALCDFAGKILCEAESKTAGRLDGHFIAELIKKGLRRLMKSNRGDTVKLHAMGVAAPGIVDCRRGIVLETDNVFGWRDLDLRAKLVQEFGVPVYVDNDVNMAALAELNSGWGRSRQNFVLIRINTGIGAGVVLDGKLYHGSHWAAGEIGHMVLNLREQPLQPNPRGYLESVVGSDRIAERLQQMAARSGASILAIAKGGELAAVVEAARQGNAEAARLVNDLVDHIGSAVVNVAATFDPELIILLGETGLALIDGIRSVAERVIPWPVEIRPSQIGDAASLQGAITAALNTAYEQISRSFEYQSAGAAGTLAETTVTA